MRCNHNNDDMIAVISKFEVRNGMEDEIKDAFRNRPKLVENAKGFVRLDVLSPLSNPAAHEHYCTAGKPWISYCKKGNTKIRNPRI